MPCKHINRLLLLITSTLLAVNVCQFINHPAVADSTQPSPSSITIRIDINTASAEKLTILPGVGPAIARRIVNHRQAHGPFPTLESIQNVKGIGPATLDKIKPYIIVDEIP